MPEANSPRSFQSPPNPMPQQPMVIDGTDRDVALASSEYLTRRELLERRSRLLKQLIRYYRKLYWAMFEDLKRNKYRDYYWTYGKSPFKEDEKEAEAIGDYPEGIEDNGKLGLAAANGGDEIRRCDVTGCKSKAMALTKYCHAHILSDTKQRLYKGCTFVIKSMQSGPLLCSKPVLRSTVPCYCPGHLQKGEKCLVRDLRKTGLNISSVSKLRPDFHVLIAEYVRQIQAKRRAAKKATAVKTEIN